MEHIAIIMDGNRRWAKEKNLLPSLGHLYGARNLKKLVKHIFYKKNIKYLSLFAFSTENFKRSQEEVGYLMKLFYNEAVKLLKKINEKNIKIVFSGHLEYLDEELKDKLEELEKSSKGDYTLNLCIAYGGQREIIDATKKIANLYKEGKISLEDIDEKEFYRYLYHELPPIDLMIRTSGEIRISNFMLYSLAYSEMKFVNTYFPAFTNKELDKVIDEYQDRNRRFGK